MEHAGLERSASGIAAAYREVAGGLVADEPAEGVPVLVTDTLMDGAEGRRRVAQAALDHCASLTR
jgi:hypothetical protein